MMTQELNVCVVAAPLAAIDRRALSQAWYSALHCASGTNSPVPERRPKNARTGHTFSGAQRARRDGRCASAPLHPRVVRAKNAQVRDGCFGTGGDRRARRSALARRIERRFLDPRSISQRATFASGGKRVHVVVQASAGRVRLVAVCPPGIREAVARALAQARFALASRGVPCS